MRGIDHTRRDMETTTIILGLILIVLGMLMDVGCTIGAILAIVGVVLWILGAMGRSVGPRAHYF